MKKPKLFAIFVKLIQEEDVAQLVPSFGVTSRVLSHVANPLERPSESVVHNDTLVGRGRDRRRLRHTHRFPRIKNEVE